MSNSLHEPGPDQLAEAMAAYEKGSPPAMAQELRWAVLAGLGSKYLAVGSPDSIGLIDCGSAAAAITACHTLLFGKLQIKVSGHNQLGDSADAIDCGMEEAFACDIVCLPCYLQFDSAWIAEATHLNLRYVAPGPSAASRLLFRDSAITVETRNAQDLGRQHGSLDEVITGQVSGRMADELTVLYHD